MKPHDKILNSAIITAVLISALHIFFCFDVYDDIASWYAPMARAFAAGDWHNAFAPSVPVLCTTMAGLLGWLGMEPFRAMVTVSCLFYVATIPVLYYMLKYFLKRGDYAAWGCMMYVVAPKIIRFSCTGLLNPARNFFIVSALALILSSSKRLRWRNSLLMGIVLAGLALARAEAVAYLPFLILWYAWFIFAGDKEDKAKCLWRIVQHCSVIIVVFFVLVSPRLWQTYRVIGVPVLDARQADYVAKAVSFNQREFKPEFHIRAEFKTETARPERKSFPKRLFDSLEYLVRGAYELYLFLALAGIFLWWKKKEQIMEYSMLLSIIVINTVIFTAIVNSVRYHTITLILLLPFTFSGVRFSVGLLPDKKFIRPVLVAGLSIVAVLQILNGSAKAISGKYDYEYNIGRWIMDNRNLFSDRERLMVAGTGPQYAYWANAAWLNISGDKTQFTEQLEQIAALADVIVLERKRRDLIEIIERQDNFKLMEQRHPEVFIFRIQKN